ncbi:unnamed protein product [Prunus armeniaca]
MILGRPAIGNLNLSINMRVMLIKFPTFHGVVIIRGDQESARTCYASSVKLKTKLTYEVCCVETYDTTNPTSTSMVVDPRGEISPVNPQSMEDLEQVAPFPEYPDRLSQIGSQLTPTIRQELIKFLKESTDLFAWSHEDMCGINLDIITHCLSIDPNYRPVHQKPRAYDAIQYAAMKTEVDKLQRNNFIHLVDYPRWLSNAVMVRKTEDKWWMCVDFTYLNKACPKDSFPLPRINQLVDATTRHELLSFMDAYSGYNQIRMHLAVQESTSFITDRGTYFYQVMLFGLKNAGATYQRLVNHMFADQIDKSMEVYVDNMMVKSIRADQHIADLSVAFAILQSHDTKLNPAKCLFRVGSGKFLGFLVSHRGIEANQEKI